MVRRRKATLRRTPIVIVVGAILFALAATSASALLARLTRIPLGRGTATITWKGATGIKPTIKSIKGSAGGYSVSGNGRIPELTSTGGSAPSIPSNLPLADIKGTIGGSPFTLDIVLTLPTSATPSKPLTIGHLTGTFRSQVVAGTVTANLSSRNFAFTGTIGTLHVEGVVLQPHQHGDTETAHATFDVTK
jgi:hypothetical protein